MLNSEKKVTIELINERNDKSANMSNPIKRKHSDKNKLSVMISQILSEEIPQLKNNSLLHDLVLYSLMEKMSTVQTFENVLSYIKESDAKSVQDVSFKNGEEAIISVIKSVSKHRPHGFCFNE